MDALATPAQRRQLEQQDRTSIAAHQLERFQQLLQTILPHNAFYQRKFTDAGVALPIDSWSKFRQLPFTTKEELVSAATPSGQPGHLTWPIDHYTRLHRTSGTRGRPLMIMDRPEDWEWWIATWQYVLDAAEVTAADRVMMAFSFGPFIGFWSAFDAVTARRAMAIPAGGMSTLARWDLLQASEATVVCCTPSYALRMAEVAAQQQIHPTTPNVRCLIVAGEPGGSIPSVRRRIEQAWQCRVVDHCGATEVGPWGYADPEGVGLHVIESEFIVEFLSLKDDTPAGEGELSEIVLTTLGRAGCPVIRYRTGDLARPSWQHAKKNQFVFLPGGALGRIDDMLIIRGMNVFPSSVEAVIRQFPAIAEFRLTALKEGTMDALRVEVEGDPIDAPGVANSLQTQLGLKIAVQTVPTGSLPRFEGKAERFVDRRTEP